MPHSLSISIEKIEMALEGHSKLNFSDEKSIKSIESNETSLFGDAVFPTRTYVVEVFQITARRSTHHDLKATRFLVDDASIVQLKDSSNYIPMKDRHQPSESQYAILERGMPSEELKNSNHAAHNRGSHGSEVLKATLFHDGTVHLDEVEVDVESVVLRVTPTSLKDCTKALRKIVEIIQLVTREMEQKVHEEGRKARRRDQDGKTNFQCMTLGVELCLTPSFFSFGSRQFSINANTISISDIIANIRSH